MDRARPITILPTSRTRPEGEASLDVSLPKGGSLSLATSLQALAGLEAAWRRLEERHLKPHQIFQSYDWVHAWAETHIAPGSGLDIMVLAGYQDGELVFIWPLVRERRGPFRVLRWLSEPLAQYGDVLAIPGQCLKSWIDAAVAFLRREAGSDILRLRHIRDDATAFSHISRRFRSSRLTERAPFLDLSVFASEADYEDRYTPTQRRRRKKIRKTIAADLGEIRFEAMPPGSTCDVAIADALLEKCRWIEERGRRDHCLRSPRLHSFLTRYAARQGGTGRLIFTRLTAGDRDLAWEIGLRAGRTHFAFITSHVNALTDYSAPRLHMDASQRLAIADGMDRFDLLVPFDSYKESWSSDAVFVRDYHLPLSSAGRFYGLVYLEVLRPLLRGVYYRLPPRILRLLKPLIGH